MISEQILMDAGGEQKSFKKNEIVFTEGQKANYYFQVVAGEIKMNNYLENGKEFIQGIFSAPRSFGEPPLFCDIPYPANAIAIVDTELIQLKKELFLKLLLSYPKIHLDLTKSI